MRKMARITAADKDTKRWVRARAYSGGDIGTCYSLGAEGALLLPWSAPQMEKLVSGYCALKGQQQKFSLKVFPKKVNKKINQGVLKKVNKNCTQ